MLFRKFNFTPIIVRRRGLFVLKGFFENPNLESSGNRTGTGRVVGRFYITEHGITRKM
jgi:hypothetical protein